MKCFLLLAPICVLVALSGCDKLQDGDDRVKKKVATVGVDHEEKPDEADLKSDKRSSLGKRQLSGRIFNVPKGNAYSYTHVVQTHGPVTKVVHVPYRQEEADDVHEGYGLYEPGTTEAPRYGPIYVTARPVLAGKPSGRAVTTDDDRPTHTYNADGLVPFTYPLFTPYYDDAIEKQYSVPVQMVYRIPLQRDYAYQQLQHPYSIDNHAYDRQAPYPLARPYAYTVHKPYVDQPYASQAGLSYPTYPDNNYIGAYTDSDSNAQDETSASNVYSSDESRR